ncbi:hypothetical protein SGRA_1537 [Saprospira grandis str. Lewin]|uniref:Uncharacterized protein n=1 Tax=Saprospira grandis (strain Lewin) TaxID=984262 RepID=H6L9A0_SAPGL|nr:hypothetical protein SGRA_1537 [Saprospira grandis str. Lewin]
MAFPCTAPAWGLGSFGLGGQSAQHGVRRSAPHPLKNSNWPKLPKGFP